MRAYASDPKVAAVLYLVESDAVARTVARAARNAGIESHVHVQRLARDAVDGAPAPRDRPWPARSAVASAGRDGGREPPGSGGGAVKKLVRGTVELSGGALVLALVLMVFALGGGRVRRGDRPGDRGGAGPAVVRQRRRSRASLEPELPGRFVLGVEHGVGAGRRAQRYAPRRARPDRRRQRLWQVDDPLADPLRGGGARARPWSRST